MKGRHGERRRKRTAAGIRANRVLQGRIVGEVAEQATGRALPWLDSTIGVHALSFRQLQARYGGTVVQAAMIRSEMDGHLDNDATTRCCRRPGKSVSNNITSSRLEGGHE